MRQSLSRSCFRQWLVVSALLTVLAVAVSSPSYAQKHGESFSQTELRSLPRVCLAQSGINRLMEQPAVPAGERKEWERKMGPGYKHLHHYCFALLYMRRSTTSPNQRLRGAQYKAAIANFNYVLRNVDARFPLKPEVHLRKGMALRLTGDVSRAAREYTHAIQLKRNYTPAYAALIEIHTDLGDFPAAMDVLSLGLQHAPESKILATKKAEIEEALGSQ